MVFAAGAQGALQLVVVAALSRMLDASDFGLVAAALTIVSFSSIVSQLGVGPALVQLPHLEDTQVRTAATVSVLMGSSLAAAVLGSASLIEGLFRMEGLAPLLRILAVVFLFEGLSTVPENLLQRALRFRAVALVSLLSYGVGFGLVGIVLAAAGQGIWALVWANVVRSAIKAAGMILVQPFASRPCLDAAAARVLLSFGTGFTGARVANYVALQGDYVVVGRWLGAAALGVYERAYRLMTMPVSLLGQAVEKVLFAAMSQVQGDRHRLRLAFERGTASTAILVFPIAVMSFVLAPEIVLVILGDGWDAVVAPFQALAVGLVFRIGYKLSNALALACAAVYARAWREAAYAVLVLGGGVLGTEWGVLGVAWAVVFAMCVNWVLMTQLALRLVDGQWSEFLRAHLAGLALGVGTLLVSGPASWLLRKEGATVLWTVLVPLGGAAIAMSCVLWVARGRLLGTHSEWIMRTWAGVWHRGRD